jgi:hypothetical protein
MDIFIAVLLGLVQALFGLAGAAVALKTWTRRARLRFAVFFVLLAICGIGLVAWQAVRAFRSSEESKEESKKISLGDARHPPWLGVISLPGITRFITTNGSDYPVYGVKIRLYDAATQTQLRNYDYPEIAAHLAFFDDAPWIPPDGAADCHFTAQITTRAGVYFEELILRRMENNQWMRAARVRQGMRTLEEDIDSAWPRDRSGQIKWN